MLMVELCLSAPRAARLSKTKLDGAP